MPFLTRTHARAFVLRCLACNGPTHNDADEDGKHHGMVCLNPKCPLHGLAQFMPKECGKRARTEFNKERKKIIYEAAREWRRLNMKYDEKSKMIDVALEIMEEKK